MTTILAAETETWDRLVTIMTDLYRYDRLIVSLKFTAWAMSSVRQHSFTHFNV